MTHENPIFSLFGP